MTTLDVVSFILLVLMFSGFMLIISIFLYERKKLQLVLDAILALVVGPS